jgi:cytochrome b pre-mRNA-processing protein 3
MFFSSAQRRQAKAVDHLYVAIVTQSREAAFYARLGVADSIEGRFEMLVLHLALVVAELERAAPPAKDAGRLLAEAFFADMDRILREIGVSDVGVPKKMKKLAEAFYGRLSRYTAAISGKDRESLVDAVVRNIYDGKTDDGAGVVSDYALVAAQALAAASGTAILADGFVWPAVPQQD